MNEETKEISIWQRITKQPKCIDREQDIWIFYCPIDKKWHKGMRHGYTDKFYTQMYFECEDGHIIPAPGWWK